MHAFLRVRMYEHDHTGQLITLEPRLPNHAVCFARVAVFPVICVILHLKPCCSTMRGALQVEEQSALNEEVWASHTALEARVAKTEERLVENGQQLMQESGHIFVAAALEQRLGTLLPSRETPVLRAKCRAHGSTLWLLGCVLHPV